MPRLLLRLLLSVVGLFVGVGIVETCARLAPASDQAHRLFNAADLEPQGLFQADLRLGMSLSPSFTGQMRLPGARIPLRVNHLGMRGPEPAPVPQPPRWLALGDSFTLALQVPEERTFSALLAQRLGNEVLNGGVSGDSTWQSVERYNRWHDPAHIDAVVLVFYLGNDITDNATFDLAAMEGHHVGPAVRRDQRPPLTGARRFLATHSFLYAHWRVLEQRRTIRGTERMAAWRKEMALYTRSGRAQLEAALPRTEQALRRYYEQVRAVRGDRALVALAPPLYAVDPTKLSSTLRFMGLDPADGDPEAPGLAVASILARLHIPTCDLAPALKEAHQNGREGWLGFDGHWSPEGHEVVADALASCIARVAR